MKAIKTHLEINRVTLKKDDSVSFSASTPELSDEQLGEFRKLQKGVVNALLEPITGSKDILEIKLDATSKSPSQRMRNTLYRLWEQDNEGKEFPVYYEVKMEKLLDYLKGKLE